MNSAPEPIEVRLDEQTVERLAHRVAELLTPKPAPAQTETVPPGRGKLVSAAKVAELWGVDRAWVYAHAEELGASRLGTGPRPRLRFDLDKVRKRLAPPQKTSAKDHPETVRTDTGRSRRIVADSSELLPFRADTELSSKDPNESRSGAQTAPPTRARRTARSTR